jgi:predicted sugar kinase
MAEWGAAGVGQSSWGPAVYGLVGSKAEGQALAARAMDLVRSGAQVFEGGFAGSGARVWRTKPVGIRD